MLDEQGKVIEEGMPFHSNVQKHCHSNRAACPVGLGSPRMSLNFKYKPRLEKSVKSNAGPSKSFLQVVLILIMLVLKRKLCAIFKGFQVLRSLNLLERA